MAARSLFLEGEVHRIFSITQVETRAAQMPALLVTSPLTGTSKAVPHDSSVMDRGMAN